MSELKGGTQGSAPESEDGALRELDVIGNHLREGRFQRSLALLAGGASLISGLEVTYEHYRGSYSERIMYTPVMLSGVLCGAGVWGFFSRRAARTALRAVSAITLLDSLLGFCFHVRGIARKPGGWSLPITNIVMGPPIFAPLLFGTAAYLGLIASYLRREDPQDAPSADAPTHRKEFPPAAFSLVAFLPIRKKRELLSFEQDMREGRFQKHMLVATALSAILSGSEAWYSHYKNAFRYSAQWAPVLLAPMLALTCVIALRERKLATTGVPALSATAVIVASVGFFYHARGIVRRPGGAKYLLYNIMYGPPIFAPLLFGAAGTLGLIASRLRRSET